jgi:hypothetical protein
MMFVGLLALVSAVLAVVLAIGLFRRQFDAESAPPSSLRDFVAPAPSGGFLWRGVDETSEEFHARASAPPR